MATRVLLTGFEPFDRASANASWRAVSALERGWGHDAALVVAELPVRFETAARRLLELVERHRPHVVIAVGLAEGREEITPERVAINVRDARIADNAGRQPVDEAIEPAGPAAYFTSLPLRPALAALGDAGLPARISDTAGTFVCNEVFYQLMRWAESRPGVQAGFVHLPQASELAREDTQPALPLADLARGLDAIVRACLEVRATSGAAPAPAR